MGIDYVGKCLLLKSGEKKILVVGDLHLGFEETLNQSGVFVSRALFKEVLEYLDKVFEKTGKVDEIVLLGDVKHNFGNIGRQEWTDVLELLDYFKDKCKVVVIVKGNHDTILIPIISLREHVTMKDHYSIGGYLFMHGDKDYGEAYDKDVRAWIVGHGHPAVKISDGVKVEKYKCFLSGKYKKKNIVIVPSFFEGNAGSDPRENNLGMAWEFKLEKFDVNVVQEDKLEVLAFGKLGKLR